MKSFWRSPMVRSCFLVIASLIMLTASLIIFIRDSQGMENRLIIGGAIMIVVSLFWLVGWVSVGRNILKEGRSWTEAALAIVFGLIVVALMIGRSLAPADSPMHTYLYFGKDIMMTGAAFWITVVYIGENLLPTELAG